LEVHDLLGAKAIAGREKDVAFVEAAANNSMADPAILLERLATVEAQAALLGKARELIGRAFRGGRIW
jgi:hypothetical protein